MSGLRKVRQNKTKTKLISGNYVAYIFAYIHSNTETHQKIPQLPENYSGIPSNLGNRLSQRSRFIK